MVSPPPQYHLCRQIGAFPLYVWARAGAAVKTAIVAKIAKAGMRISISLRIDVVAQTHRSRQSLLIPVKSHSRANAAQRNVAMCQLYLHYTLALWTARWLRHCGHWRHDPIIVRYADDFIIGFEPP
jgi:hypothetical protein